MTALVLAALIADTPEATITAFVAAFNAGDTAGMARQVAGKTRPTTRMGVGGSKLEVKIAKSTISDDDAYLEVDTAFTGTSTPPNAKGHSVVHLRRENGDWRIVPESFMSVPSLGVLATIVTDSPSLNLARRAAESTQSLSNVKQLAIATIMYANDHNERLPAASRFKVSIMPYLRNSEVFTAPGATKGTVGYFFEPRLSGWRFSAIPNLSATAMILQGTPKKTAFPYRGRTPLGYADGHVKMVPPADVLKARTISLR
jgi:hypothetical protein